MTGFSIVRADLSNSDHATAWKVCTLAYACDQYGAGAPLSEETLNRSVEYLRTFTPTVVFLAFAEDGRPAGLATCFRGFGTFAGKPLINVHDLAVVPAFRRFGLGRRLLQAVIDLATAEGAGKVTLEVLNENAPAKALYDSMGFEFTFRFGHVKLG